MERRRTAAGLVLGGHIGSGRWGACVRSSGVKQQIVGLTGRQRSYGWQADLRFRAVALLRVASGQSGGWRAVGGRREGSAIAARRVAGERREFDVHLFGLYFRGRADMSFSNSAGFGHYDRGGVEQCSAGSWCHRDRQGGRPQKHVRN